MNRQPIDQGKRAFTLGCSPSENPFPRDTVSRDDWQRGHGAAEEADLAARLAPPEAAYSYGWDQP